MYSCMALQSLLRTRSLDELVKQLRARVLTWSLAALSALAYAPAVVANEQPPQYGAREQTVAHDETNNTRADTVIVRRGDNLWSIVTNQYALHNAEEQTIAARVRDVCAANIPQNNRYARDTRRVTYDPVTNQARVEHAPDSIACDELEPGDRMILPVYEQTPTRSDTVTPVPSSTSSSASLSSSVVSSETPQKQSSRTPALVLGALAATAALAGAAYVAKTTSSARRQHHSGTGNALDDAITLYLGNYAHGGERDLSVKDIVRETGVSSSRLYKTLRSRGIATRREQAVRARDYLAEKLAAVRARGESVRDAAPSYGLSHRTASRLAHMYTH